MRLGGESLTGGMMCLEQLGVLERREGLALWHSCNMYCQDYLVVEWVSTSRRDNKGRKYLVNPTGFASCVRVFKDMKG